MPPTLPEPETLTELPELSADQRGQVRALAAAASLEDGVSPLSEHGLLALDHGPGTVRHLLWYGDTAPGRGLVGYAQLAGEAGSEPEAELVVAPAARRTGVASALLDRLPVDVRIWAHGGLEAAAAFAEARGLTPVRVLHVLGRAMDAANVVEGAPDDLTSIPETVREIGLPHGFRVRRFEPGRDEEEWLRVNAAAFAHHPEQGRWSRQDLDERLRSDWFDPDGLLLLIPTDAGAGDSTEDADHAVETVAAFHWTKVHAPGDVPLRLSPRGDVEEVGEVYVLGVDPAYQGRGLARPATMVGLWHLARERRVRDVILYVDGDNAPALAVYRRLGFEDRGLDRMYVRARQPTVHPSAAAQPPEG